MSDPPLPRSQVRRYVFDASAITIFLADEAGHDEISRILLEARAKKTAAYLTMFSLAELLTREEHVSGERGAKLAWTRVQAMPIKFVDVDRSLALAAAHIKALYALATADPFAAALAKCQNAILVTSNEEYHKLNDLVAIRWLPAQPATEGPRGNRPLS